MPKEVIMPKLGLTMETGVIEKWLKKEGEYVQKGEPLFEVTTDKATMEVESIDFGYLRKIMVGEGQEITVTSIIAYIGDKDEELFLDNQDQAKSIIQEITKASAARSPKLKDTPITQDGSGADTQTPNFSIGKQDRIITSPLARKLAIEFGVDLSKIKGSGPGGRIIKEDVLAVKEVTSAIVSASAIQAIQTAQTSEQKVDTAAHMVSEPALLVSKELKLTGIKKIVALRMKQSYSDAPHIYLELSCDMSEASRLKEKANKAYLGKSHLTYTDIIIKATSQVLKLNPLLNATLKEDSILIYDDINIGIATSTDRGLVVPVLKAANRLSLFEISTLRQDITERAKDGKQTLDDLSGGTFTITNLGMFGIESFRPIITPNQAAILAVGMIKMSPVVDEVGNICARPLMTLSLACDHRIVDGADGARFLSDLKEMLENPAMML